MSNIYSFLNNANKLARTIFTLGLFGLFIISISSQAQSTYFKADNGKIQYTGRIDVSDPMKPSFSWPGISIKAKFSGSAISMVMDDASLGGITTTNYYNILIDGVVDTVMEVNSTDTLYSVASGLSNDNHTIEIFKRTESSVGSSAFLGLSIENGILLDLDAQPSRKVEFVGDSWTCGYGNEESFASGTNSGFHSDKEDNYEAWGAITCRRLNAQYHATAISGRGMYRNNTGSTSSTMPTEYEYTHAGNAASQWDHNSYHPDVIVVKLGTNDFFPQTWATPDMLDSADYVGAYVAFVTKLSQYHPNAEIIMVYGSSMTDWYPLGLAHLTTWERFIMAAKAHLEGQGVLNLNIHELATQQAPYGEDWHPSKPTHYSMADEITPVIQNIMGWNTGEADCAGVLGGSGVLDECDRCTLGNTSLEACSVSGTKDLASDLNFKLYPNPASDHIILELDAQIQNWSIINSSGTKVTSGTESKINVDGLYQGFYSMRLQTKEGVIIRQFVIN